MPIVSPLEIVKDHLEPRLRQVVFFLPNRLGALRSALKLLSEESVRIAGMSLLDSSDHVVVRLVVDRPDEAHAILGQAGYGSCISECLGVTLPTGPRFGILHVLSLLLAAEVSVSYAYALILRSRGHPLLALMVENLDLAARAMQEHGFTLVDQKDLLWDETESHDL